MQRIRITGALVSLCLLTTAHLRADDRCCEGGDSFSKTTFSIQRSLPQFEAGSPLRESFFHNDRMDDANGYGGALQVTVFGGESNDENELARYFSPNCKSRFVVANDAALNHGATQRDVDARNLNIRFSNVEDPFESVVSFCPEVDYVGAGLAWKQALCRNDEDQITWWFEAAAPIIHVETRMGLQEKVRQGSDLEADNIDGLNGNQPVNRARKFFAQRGLKFGRIDQQCHDDTQLAQLEFKLGYNSVMTDHCYLNSYIGVIAPTSEEYNEQDENCNDFRQVLQPITGTGGHWALMYGTHLGFHICDYEQWSFRTALDINGRYLFEEDEFRTFDLKGKPWSRYMQFYTPEQAAEAFADANKVGIGTSGVNLLTRCAEVTPGYDGRVNTAFIFERCNFAVELGFNVNYQQAEEIECPSLAKEPFAIKAAGGLGEIDPLRTIGKNCDDTIQAASEEEARQNVRDNAITRNDLDLSSASHPATLHHTVYGNLGYNFEHNCIPGFISVGGSYTFGATNNELENWALWGKLGISF